MNLKEANDKLKKISPYIYMSIDALGCPFLMTQIPALCALLDKHEKYNQNLTGEQRKINLIKDLEACLEVEFV